MSEVLHQSWASVSFLFTKYKLISDFKINIYISFHSWLQMWWCRIEQLLIYNFPMAILGAFLIPYCLALFVVGFPIMYMEMAFGQFASLGTITIWRVCPLFKGSSDDNAEQHVSSLWWLHCIAGAFLIPYILALLVVGFPIMFMEMALGQFASIGPITIWRVCPLFKGIHCPNYSWVLSRDFSCKYSWFRHACWISTKGQFTFLSKLIYDSIYNIVYHLNLEPHYLAFTFIIILK